MMKTITIIGAEKVEMSKALAFGNHDLVVSGTDMMSASDGYHTFDELYEHRITLYIALCRIWNENYRGIWRSKLHSDGKSFDGWYVLGLGKLKDRQITYHIPLNRWNETGFAETLEKAPKWDGHTSQDVLERLKQL